MSQLISFALTQAAPEVIIDTETGATEPSLNMQSSREFVIGANSVFDGATFKIQKYLSDNTGYTDYVDPSTGNPIVFSKLGAGFGLTFYDKVGKIKFIASGATGTTNITIDLIK